MSLLALALVFPGAALVAHIGGRIHDRRTAARAPRRPVGARWVDAPGFPQPLVHRQPGQTGATYGPTPSQIAEWESDDCLPADDIWCVWYPPGSLGDYPDGMPTQPGRLGVEDGLDVVIAASKLTRAAAEQRKSA